MAEGRKGGTTAIVATLALLLGLIVSFPLLLTSDSTSCGPNTGVSGPSVSVDPETVPQTEVAGYGHDQLVNAAYVIAAGEELGLDARDQTIGVMTAMGESSLENIDYGDWETGGVVNPDGSPTTSIGLFQQQESWGTVDERMDPFTTSTLFFNAMIERVADRAPLEPTIVAHQTQVNADPYHYEPYWDPAIAVVEALGDVSVDAGSIGTADPCGGSGGGTPGEINSEGWAAPAIGPLTSPYGPLVDPVTGGHTMFHVGIDIAPACDEPIWAIQDGVVIREDTDQYGGNSIFVDHGEGVVARYHHMYESGIIARTGDEVEAGEQIAKIGSSGWSTGCHIHFEIIIDGEHVDPEVFLAEVGVTV